jgi:RNA-binding protein Musashi
LSTLPLSRFGYVLDVYMPRDRAHRAEHRGFGFVTFETATSLRRVAAASPHTLLGAALAIDTAVPRREDGDDSGSASGPPTSPGATVFGGAPRAAPADAAFGDGGLHAGPARGHEPRPRAAYKPY